MIIPRLALYGTASTLLFAMVISSALKSRPNFYSAAVAIGRSSGALMVLANFALFNAIWVGVVLKTVFFGRLRAIEYEHLFEKLWIFLTESLLALTIFRDDFSAPFAFMYGVLLFLKCFHWITADRVDYMDQIPPPGPPALFHIRTSLIITLLTIADLVLVTYSLESILLDGVSAMVLFASEFMILLASIGGTTARYVVGLVDLRRARGRVDAPSWEEKSMWLFYVDLAVDFVKLLTYLSFFAVILLHYGLPLHILRDVYMTLRSFLGRVGDLIRYRRATRDMDALYPDATPEEVERTGDRTCIICREEMVARDTLRENGERATGDGDRTRRPNDWRVVMCSISTVSGAGSRGSKAVRPAPAGRPRNVDPRAAPPPPAPGALPQANRPAQPQLPPNPIQLMYEQYFRPPAATPPPIPNGNDQPAPAAAAGMPETGVQDTATGEGDDRRIQRGIWGGPITPGRFFAAPLGTVPRWQSSRIPAATRLTPVRSIAPVESPSGVAVAVPTEAALPAAPASATDSREDSREPARLQTQPVPSIVTESSPAISPNLASGSTTPFFSNPPQIFSSPGTSRDGETEARRAAAEAAMRRMGLGVSPLMPIASGGADSSTSPVLSDSVADEASAEGSGKGKGKAKATGFGPEPGPLEGDLPKHVPYLTAPTSTLGTTAPRKSWTSMPTSREGARTALAERIRLLRNVDDSVWQLVSELSRVKSEWEAEDEELAEDVAS
ncbi:E3 ubiquitin-protein ligase hrd1 [Saitozyma podzolica]|uniref:E3 ubiquitin-protein ligase hrd1 n=1 Tax=Saitozyma podzolica TaxID=1890683 RepID=A0A427YT83_9TREE|nr:E3 ubiquitin-protein ligase hrd1 [Saitozyma podzolica]